MLSTSVCWLLMPSHHHRALVDEMKRSLRGMGTRVVEMDEVDGARAILKAVNRDPSFGNNPAMQSELEQVSEDTHRSTVLLQ